MAMKKKWAVLIVLLIAVVLGSIVGYARWRHSQIYVKTSNAYVRGKIFSVSARIPGKLATVNVEDNQRVKKGQVIATIDPADFDAAVASAEANLAEAETAVESRKAAIERRKADVIAAKSRLDLAEIEYKRIASLYSRKSIPKQKLDEVVTQKKVAEAMLNASKKAVSEEIAGLKVLKRKIEVAKTMLATARLNRSYCTIVSPTDGTVSKKNSEPGDVVAPGQPLCAIVPLDVGEIWVEANYKETKLKRVKPGQKVTLKVDADKSRTITGRVESISAGTGAAFSLLPPENATGNWVKVVQRLPVRIAIDKGSDPEHLLRLGLSVTCTIDTNSK